MLEALRVEWLAEHKLRYLKTSSMLDCDSYIARHRKLLDTAAEAILRLPR